eukprot:g5703.t1
MLTLLLALYLDADAGGVPQLRHAQSGQPSVRGLRLGGLFPLFKTKLAGFSADSSGHERQAAFLMAVRELNARTQIDALSRDPKDRELKRWLAANGVQIEYVVRDSKRDSAEALFGALHVLQNGSMVCDAIVGPASSSPAVAVSYVAGKMQTPVMSYSATSPKLSEAKLYEYFLRTPPSDAVSTEAWGDILASVLGWKQVAIVAGSDAYGVSGAQAFRTQAVKNSISVVADVSISEDATDFTDQLQILSKANSRVVWMIAQTELSRRFVLAAHAAGVLRPGVTVLGADATDQAFRRLSADEATRSIVTGAFGLVSARSRDAVIKDAWFARWREQRPPDCGRDTDSAGRLLWQQDHDEDPSTPDKCNAPSFTKAAGPDDVNSYAFYAYDATYAMAHAFKALFSDETSESFKTSKVVGRELRERLLDPSLKFTGLTGDVYFSNGASSADKAGQGDRVGAAFELFNYNGRAATASHVGTWVNDGGVKTQVGRFQDIVITQGKLNSAFAPNAQIWIHDTCAVIKKLHHNCVVCPADLSKIYIAIVVALIFVLMVMMWIIVLTQRKGTRGYEAGKEQDFGPTILFKSFITWVQTMAMVATFDIDWPSFIHIYLNSASGAGYLSETLRLVDDARARLDQMVFDDTSAALRERFLRKIEDEAAHLESEFCFLFNGL